MHTSDNSPCCSPKPLMPKSRSSSLGPDSSWATVLRNLCLCWGLQLDVQDNTHAIWVWLLPIIIDLLISLETLWKLGWWLAESVWMNVNNIYCRAVVLHFESISSSFPFHGCKWILSSKGKKILKSTTSYHGPKFHLRCRASCIKIFQSNICGHIFQSSLCDFFLSLFYTSKWGKLDIPNRRTRIYLLWDNLLVQL